MDRWWILGIIKSAVRLRHGSATHLISYMCGFRILKGCRSQIRFHLFPTDLNGRALSADRLNRLRAVPNRLDDALQNARSRSWFDRRLRLFLLDDFGWLNRCQLKQALGREVMMLTLNAGFLDLNRKSLDVPLHLIC